MALWVTVTEADTYFATRLGALDVWTASVDKTAALTTAQNQLIASGRFLLPAPPNEALAEAVCEQALFLLRHGDGVDRRTGLRDMGVRRAGVVEETYEGEAGRIPVCAQAMGILRDYRVGDRIRTGRIWRDDAQP